ncbi:unnamed protein product [Brassica oleracea]
MLISFQGFCLLACPRHGALSGCWMALRCWLVVLQLSMCFQRSEISLLQYFWYFPTPPPAVIAT